MIFMSIRRSPGETLRSSWVEEGPTNRSFERSDRESAAARAERQGRGSAERTREKQTMKNTPPSLEGLDVFRPPFGHLRVFTAHLVQFVPYHPISRYFMPCYICRYNPGIPRRCGGNASHRTSVQEVSCFVPLI